MPEEKSVPIPEHRAAFPSRSGDTHVIGEDGELRNVDKEARDAEVAVLAEEGTTFFADAGEMMGQPGEALQSTSGTTPAEPIRNRRNRGASDIDA